MEIVPTISNFFHQKRANRVQISKHPKTMPNVSTYLDTRRAKAGGKFPLKFAVSFGRRSRFLLPTGIDLDQKHWNGHEVIRDDNKLLYNQLIGYKKLEIERALLEADRRGITNPDSVRRTIERTLSGSGKAATFPVRDAFSVKMNLLSTESTRAIYKRCLDAIGEFANLDGLMMSELNYRWLCDFEAHLRNTNSVNTTSILLRSLRSVFNHLIKAEEIESDCYPFRRFSIKQEETRKRSLTLEQLRTIRDHGSRASDIFMLMVYLIGINTSDLCSLKEISANGRIDYRRSKTGRLYSVKVEPEALAIINKYRGQEWLINIFDRRKNPAADHHTFMYKINKQLKGIVPGISTYWSRHTWATLAAELDIPNETIAQGLGHSYGNNTTAIYIKPNPRKVDEANRKIIDYINGDLNDQHPDLK